MSNPLEVEVNGHRLVFYPKTKVKFIKKNTLFQLKAEAPSRAYTWKIPALPNQIALKFSNQLDNRTPQLTHACKLYLFDNFWCNAVLDITDFNNEEYGIRVRIDRGAYAEFAQKSLRDFSYKNPYEYRFHGLSSRAYSEFEFNDNLLTGGVSGITSTITLSYKGMKDFAAGNPYKTKDFYYTDDATTIPELEASYAEFIAQVVTFLNNQVHELGFHCIIDPLDNKKFKAYQLFGSYAPSLSAMLVFSAGTPMAITIDTVSDVSPAQNLDTYYMDTVNTPVEDYTFFPVYTPSMFAAQLPSLPAGSYINMYKPRVPGNPSYPGDFCESELVPFPFLKYIFYQMHQEGGIRIELDEFFDAENSTLVLMNDWPISDLYYYPWKDGDWPRGSCFKYSNIVPDITLAQLINDMRYTFNTLIDYDSRNSALRIIPIKNFLASKKYDDWTGKIVDGYSYTPAPVNIDLALTHPGTEELASEALPDVDKIPRGADVSTKLLLPVSATVSEIRYVIKENNFYRFNLVTSQWDLFAQGHYNYKSNKTNPQQITVGCDTLFSNQNRWPSLNFFGLYDADILLPYTKARTSVASDVDQPSALRFMYYRGFQTCKVKLSAMGSWIDGEYPMGTAHNYDADGNQIGNYSLSLNAPEGIINTWYAQWFSFLAGTSPVKIKVTLTIKELLELDILVAKRINNQEFFIDEIEFEFTENTTDYVVAIATIYQRKAV